MKLLRILTGAHAGIETRLVPGQYRIGSGQDTDICITDWDDAEVTIELDEAGIIRVRKDNQPAAAVGTADPSVILIPDLVPFPFGNTVVCFGSNDAPWPPDIDLLANLYANRNHDEVDGAVPPYARRVARIALLCAIFGALAAAGMFLFNTHSSYAANVPAVPDDPHELARQLAGALHAAKLDGLHATAQGSTIVVDGMVLNSAEDIAARSVFTRFGQGRIARQYDVAQADVANLEESLGIDGVHVGYQGDGVFSVTGPVPSMTEFNAALNRVRADLDGNIKHIEVGVTEVPSAISMTPYTEMIAVNNVRYVQTTDGVKHLFQVTPPEPDRSAAPRTPQHHHVEVDASSTNPP